MSRAKNGFRPPKPKQHPPIQQQLDMCLRGISRLAEHLSELELMVEFTMRQVRMGRVKPGGIIDPATGKMPVEHLNLADLFYQQREAFIAVLLQERDAITRAQQAASEFGQGYAPAQGNGQAGNSAHAGASDSADGDTSADPLLDRATGLYIIGGES